MPAGVLRAGQIVLAAALLALLWRVAGGDEALRSLATAQWGWLVAAVAILTLQTGLSALRWKLTAGRLGIRLGAREALREYYLAQAVNVSVPGGVVGDAGRALRSRAQAGLLAAGQAVLFERLAGQAGLYVILVASFAVTLTSPGGIAWPTWLLLPVAVFIAAGLCLPLGLGRAKRIRGRMGSVLCGLRDAARRSLLAPPVIVPQIALSLATALCNLTAFGVCAVAVGHGLSPAAIAAFGPIILLTMLVPVTISGWGLREGAAVVLFPLAGGTASGGLTASIAFGLMLIAASLPGAVAVLGGARRDRVDP
ncbi:lysylphosphatidylglycerol synthase transmembrane domain-containing protein [Roseovarius sp. D22-M7]|uniref:lysylphosphatidylglycerol synthase transmembrane domain-containing protein n=1 Tax=Roseovarius sp. D22-M7 TaxID=3127116 RepID=UPI0030105CAF